MAFGGQFAKKFAESGNYGWFPGPRAKKHYRGGTSELSSGTGGDASGPSTARQGRSRPQSPISSMPKDKALPTQSLAGNPGMTSEMRGMHPSPCFSVSVAFQGLSLSRKWFRINSCEVGL